MCSNQPTIGNILDEIAIIVGRCAVAGENAVTSIRAGWQGGKPAEMVSVELRMGISIRCTHPCRIGSGHPSVMVATNGQTVGGYQQIADLAGPQRAGDTISQIDYAIDIAVLDVGEHSFQRRQVPVDVRDDGDAHAHNLLGEVEPRKRCAPIAAQSGRRRECLIGRDRFMPTSTAGSAQTAQPAA